MSNKKTYAQMKSEVDSIFERLESEKLPENVVILDESSDQIELFEKLMTFGGVAYPKFGNVVILAGGAGSGKGFNLANLVGIEGKVFDVDALKSLAMKAPGIVSKIKSETGLNISKFNLKNPDHVAKLHTVLDDTYHLPARQKNTFMSTVMVDSDRKPNMIFDVTLKSVKKLVDISTAVQELGYDKKNIHIVWILNELDVALDQNRKRDRVVPEHILIDTHEGVSITMHKFLADANMLRKYMDGDFYISFNRVGVDSVVSKSAVKTTDKFRGTIDKKGKITPSSKLGGEITGGGFYVEKANYIKIKEQGNSPMSLKELGSKIVGDQDVLSKIRDYTPDIQSW
jgi:hypothetical protein